jgi:excisionase family DNA binding protein
MRSPEPEPLTEEEANDLAVKTVRAIRAERSGASWSVRKVADYLGCSPRHVRRLIAAGELQGERSEGSRSWAVPVRSMLAFEDRSYAARVRADRSSRELDALGASLE